MPRSTLGKVILLLALYALMIGAFSKPLHAPFSGNPAPAHHAVHHRR